MPSATWFSIVSIFGLGNCLIIPYLVIIIVMVTTYICIQHIYRYIENVFCRVFKMRLFYSRSLQTNILPISCKVWIYWQRNIQDKVWMRITMWSCALCCWSSTATSLQDLTWTSTSGLQKCRNSTFMEGKLAGWSKTMQCDNYFMWNSQGNSGSREHTIRQDPMTKFWY